MIIKIKIIKIIITGDIIIVIMLNNIANKKLFINKY